MQVGRLVGVRGMDLRDFFDGSHASSAAWREDSRRLLGQSFLLGRAAAPDPPHSPGESATPDIPRANRLPAAVSGQGGSVGLAKGQLCVGNKCKNKLAAHGANLQWCASWTQLSLTAAQGDALGRCCEERACGRMQARTRTQGACSHGDRARGAGSASSRIVREARRRRFR